MPSTSSRGSQSAERVRRMQAQAAKRARTRRLAIAGSAIAVVVVVVAALVIAKLAGGGGSTNDAAPPQTGLAAVVSGVTSVPAAALDSVGAGTALGLKGAGAGATALTDGGTPEMLYVGGEFCPYCAASRWGAVVALSRFGTFKGLGLMSSSSNDVYPDTPTLTFHGASYTSQYLAFHGYETLDRDKQPLDTLPTADSATFHTYDNTPYTSSPGGIPFVDIGGKWFLYGSAYDPQVLHGLTQAQIVADLKSPSSPVAQAILGEANLMSAAICQSTNQQPSSVCSSAGVKAAAARLSGSG